MLTFYSYKLYYNLITFNLLFKNKYFKSIFDVSIILNKIFIKYIL